MADARARKAVKYIPRPGGGWESGRLQGEAFESGGWITRDAGRCREATDAPRKECTSVCLHITRAAILGSFSIWVPRNHAI